MPLPSILQSLSCVSPRSSKLSNSSKKRTQSIKSNKSSNSSSTLPGNGNRPSAPPNKGDQSPTVTLPVSDSQSTLDSEDDSFSFWQIGNYKKTLKRCDNGSKLGSELSKMIEERAQLEDSYVRSLKNWYKKWNQDLNSKELPEYGTTKDGWKAFLEVGNQTAEVHSDLAKRLINEPIFKIKDWLKKNYERHFFNFKRTKEFESEFEMAERSWVDLNEKLRKVKKEYYESIKNTQQSEQTAQNAQSNPKLNQEQREKLEEKAKKAKDEEAKARKRYQDTVKETELYQDHHVGKMSAVFNKTQLFEKERILFFKQIFNECHDILQIHTDPRFDDLFQNYVNTINDINQENDVNFWSKRFGVETKPVWPAFEEYQQS